MIRYTEEQEQERTKESTPEVDMKNQENISDQITLTSRLEAVEQKLFKLQSLKDETLIEFSSILTECKKMLLFLFKLIYLLSAWTNPSFEQITSHEHYRGYHLSI